MTAAVLVLPYTRNNLHIPRRDIVVASGDSLALQVTLVGSDDTAALPIVLPGTGSPGITLSLWRDRTYGWPPDYGLLPSLAAEVFYTVDGTVSPDFDGTWDVFIPIGTFNSIPLRCGWSIQFTFDTGVQSQMISWGSMNIYAMPPVVQ